MSFEFEFPQNLIGLDISERSIRLVQLKKKGKKLKVASFNDINIPANLITNGEIIEQQKVAAIIQKLIKTAKGEKINTKDVVSVLPEPQTFIKVIKIEKTDDDLKQLVETEMSNHIPLDLNEAYTDWEILAEKNNTATILVGATSKTVSDSQFITLQKAGLLPLSLEVEALAITRALLTKKDEINKSKIIIDFGAARTSLIITDNGIVQFTINLPISGDKLTKTIATTLNLDPKKAEKAKIVCGLDEKKCEGALKKVLFNTISDLSTRVKKANTYYKNHFPDNNEVSEILLCGGGANFSQIDRVLSDKTGLPVVIGDPFVNQIVNKSSKIAIPTNKTLSYTTAIGLALIAFDK